MIGAVIQRLRDTAMPPLTSVEGAEELEALAKGTAPRAGAAFVIPFREQGNEPETISGGYRQHVETTLLVAVVLRKAADSRGASRLTEVDAVRAALEAALAGWTPDLAAHRPLALVGTEASPQANGVTWYVQTWATDRWIERRP